MKKKFTKKYIHSVLRTEDRTKIFRLYTQVKGRWEGNNEMMKYAVVDFIKEYAPTQRISNKAYEIACPTPPAEDFPGQCRKSDEFYNQNGKHNAMNYLRYELSMPLDNYSKFPLMGHTHLYFASPVYGHRDYNKRCMMQIEGNERFCELICRVGERYFQRMKAEAEG